MRPPKTNTACVGLFEYRSVDDDICATTPTRSGRLGHQRAAIATRLTIQRLKRLVRQLPVVTQRDSQAPGDEIHDPKAVERLPGEVKQRQQRANVHGANKRHVRYIRPQPLSHKRVLLRLAIISDKTPYAPVSPLPTRLSPPPRLRCSPPTKSQTLSAPLPGQFCQGVRRVFFWVDGPPMVIAVWGQPRRLFFSLESSSSSSYIHNDD